MMSRYVKKRKNMQTTVRFNKKFIEQMDFNAKRLGLSRNELIEYSVDFAIANFDQFQLALIRHKEILEKLDSATTEEELVNGFRKLKEAMKI